MYEVAEPGIQARFLVLEFMYFFFFFELMYVCEYVFVRLCACVADYIAFSSE